MGGRRCFVPARERLAKAAAEVFAKSGYHGASLRDIAAQGGADKALVIRYYGGKEGLFHAALENEFRAWAASNPARNEAGVAPPLRLGLLMAAAVHAPPGPAPYASLFRSMFGDWTGASASLAENDSRLLLGAMVEILIAAADTAGSA